MFSDLLSQDVVITLALVIGTCEKNVLYIYLPSIETNYKYLILFYTKQEDNYVHYLDPPGEYIYLF